jgi:hypothetical protein
LKKYLDEVFIFIYYFFDHVLLLALFRIVTDLFSTSIFQIAQKLIEVNLIEREVQEDLDLQESKKIKLDGIIPPNSSSESSTSASTGSHEGKNIINLCLLLIIYTILINIYNKIINIIKWKLN